MRGDLSPQKMRFDQTLSRTRHENEKTQRSLLMNFQKHSQPSSEETTKEGTRESTPPITKTEVHIHVNINNSTNISHSKIIQNNTKAFVNDINKNVDKNKNGRRWSIKTLMICTIVYLLSRQAYSALTSSVVLPSEKTVRRYISNQTDFIDTRLLTNISNIPNITSKYREINNLDDTIVGVLGVDAIALKPIIKIDENGNIIGLNESVQIPHDQIELLKIDLNKQEEIVKQFQNFTVNNAFLFHFQPISPYYPCMTVHIQPSTTGKASVTQISLLKQIEKELKKQNFIVISFSTDGDSGYQTLVNETLSRRSKENIIFDLSKPLFISDPLHILKRGRYRYLSHNFVYFSRKEKSFNYTQIVSLINLHSYVFDNSRITKMHDELPLKLFDISRFKLLYDINYTRHCAYFLPFSFLATALDNPYISIDDRVDLLEIAEYFLIEYQKLMKTNTDPKTRPAQKGNKSCFLFDNKLIDDLVVTIMSIKTIIQNHEGALSLNRLGTNPIEHHFGLLRIRSKYKNEILTLLTQESYTRLISFLENSLFCNTVTKRRKTFGEILILKNLQYGTLLTKEIAKNLLNCFDIIPKKPLDKTLKLSFEKFLNKICSNSEEKQPKRKYITNSNDMTVSSSAQIRSILENKEIKIPSQLENQGSFQISADDFEEGVNGLLDPVSSSEFEYDQSDSSDPEYGKKRTRKRQTSSQP